MPTVKKQLDKILRKVHRGFRYVSDEQQYGVDEKWVTPDIERPVVGDCEDFALACRQLCRKEGIPTRLVLCLTEDGGGHCVLECDGWILDNRHTTVKNRSKLKYKWLTISGYEAGDPWHRITNG